LGTSGRKKRTIDLAPNARGWGAKLAVTDRLRLLAASGDAEIGLPQTSRKVHPVSRASFVTFGITSA